MRQPRGAVLPNTSGPPSLYELEKICIGGHRSLISRFSREPLTQGLLPPTVTRVIPAPSSSKFQSLKLVPGGCFLISTTCDEIHLWDLHTPGSSSEQPRLIARTAIQDPWQVGNLEVSCHRFSWKGPALNIAITLDCSSVESVALNTFEILPGTPNPEFKLIYAVSPYREWFKFSSCLEGRASFHIGTEGGDDEALGLHDFETNVILKWFTGEFTFDFADLIPGNKNIVVALCSSKLCTVIFRIPTDFTQFLDHELDNGFVVIDNPPVTVIPWSTKFVDLGAPDTLHGFGVTRWVPSYDENSSPMCVDFWARFNDRDDSVLVDRVCLAGPNDTSWFTQQHSAEYSNLDLWASDTPYSKTFPDGTRVLWWEPMDMPSLKIHFSQLGDSQSEPLVSGVLELGIKMPAGRRSLYWATYSFEPLIGRACVIGKKGIQVLDYFV